MGQKVSIKFCIIIILEYMTLLSQSLFILEYVTSTVTVSFHVLNYQEVYIFRLDNKTTEYRAEVKKNGKKRGKACPKLEIFRISSNFAIELNEGHKWFDQIQGQLHITGIK